MSTATPVDRETASRLNPLISNLWTADTLDTVAVAIDELGHIVSDTELSIKYVFVLFSAAAAALAWERDNIRLPSHATKESSHV